jgi:kynureninase
MMGSLTANLHVLMASFYRPTPSRRAILIEPHAFPSDRYAAESQIAWHGGDPERDLVTVEAAHPDRVTVDDLNRTLERHGDRVALGLIGGVNYLTGQFLDLEGWVRRLRAFGIPVGLDLAHAAGNVPLALHDVGCDFAAWCTYKYLNGGPGSTSGIFVHERHHDDVSLPRLGGWWGNDPSTRFDMHGQEHFVPRRSADGWKASNPSILALAPVRGSLELFTEVGMGALRARSMRLTAHLERGLDAVGAEVVTPRDPAQRGCQLSVRVRGDAGALEAALAGRGVVVDARDPDIIRLAPTPLYSTFADNTRAVRALGDLLRGR